jgi:hypothetical protein
MMVTNASTESSDDPVQAENSLDKKLRELSDSVERFAQLVKGEQIRPPIGKNDSNLYSNHRSVVRK